MQIFQKKQHKIIQADFIEALQMQILDNSVDLIFADPPYNIGKDFNGLAEKWETEESYLEWCYEVC